MSYLAQVSLYWLLLYGCYWLVLRRHTFFVWNRAYLLGSLLGAFALPLVPYPEASTALPTITYAADVMPVAMSAPTPFTVYAQPAAKVPSWEVLLGVLYAAGILFMLVRLVLQFRVLFSFIQKGERIRMENYTLILLSDNQVGSFSFLNYIVINRTDYAENLDTILNHELVHVRQRHSWDILLVEVLRVVFWFNPVLILYKKSLQQLHEYLADREVCTWEATPRDRYAEFMISYALGSPMVSLVNSFFNSSLLKNRIAMLYKNRNSKWSLGKYAAVALLVGFVSLLAASCEQKANERNEKNETAAIADKAIIVEGTITSTDGTPLPGAEIRVKGAQTGTTTTAQGEFKIHAPAGSELDFSFIGHKKASIKMNEQGTVKVALAQESASESSMAERTSSETGRLGMSQKPMQQSTPNYTGDSVYTVVKKNPEFPGGYKALLNFIQDEMKYPSPARRANVEGKVFLTFVVNSDGSIQDIRVLKGLGFGCDEEAIRVLKQTPKWIAGEKPDGGKVRVKYNLPISFELPIDFQLEKPEPQEDKEKRQGNVIKFTNYQMPEFKFENSFDIGSPEGVQSFDEVTMPASGTSKTRFSNYSSQKLFPTVVPPVMIINRVNKFKREKE